MRSGSGRSDRTLDYVPADLEITEVDLATEEVYVGGQRLTPERAEQIAADVLAKRAADLKPGRKSLSGEGTHSSRVNTRLAESTYAKLEERAAAEKVSKSVLTRSAIEKYLAS